MMKKYIAYAVLALVMAVTGILVAGCDSREKSPAAEALYTTEHYFEALDGTYVPDGEATESKRGEIGGQVTASALTREGFTYDAENAGNVASGEVAADGSLVLKLYYKRNVYKVTVLTDGSAERTAKYGEAVVLDGAYDWEITAGTAQLSGNTLTVGTTDVTVTGTPRQTEASYTTEHYFEALDGTYVPDGEATESKRGEIGGQVTASALTREGFTYDAENAGNVASGEVAADGSLVLKLYYKRNVYKVTVLTDGSAERTAKYGEAVVLDGAYEWEITAGTAQLSGNTLTVGTTDVTVLASLTQKYILSETLFTAAEGEISVPFPTYDANGKQGILFLYNTPQTQNVLDAEEEYFIFYTKGEGGTVTAYLERVTEDGGSILGENPVSLAAGENTYKVSYGTGGIVCYIGGNEVLRSAYTPEFGGLTGIWLDKGVPNEQKIQATEAMSEEEFRAYAERILTTFELPVYGIGADSLIHKETVVYEAQYIAALQTEYNQIKVALNGCADLSEAIAYFTAYEGNIRGLLAREGVWDSLYRLPGEMSEMLLYPYIGTEEDSVPVVELAGMTIQRDIYARDSRWYIPSGYMIYSGQGGANSQGILDFLNTELVALQNGAPEDYLAIADRYITDIVRAVCMHDIEYFHAYWYNKTGAGSVTNIWQFIWTYTGIMAESPFVYVGCVDGYVWTGDQYRLNATFFKPDSVGYVGNDYNAILAGYCWMRDRQIRVDSSYTVTLNANGGELDQTVLTGSSAADLALPEPVMADSQFLGWYANRAFLGNPVSVIAAPNRSDITLYAKWSATESVLMPDPFYGENMLLPRNKQVAIRGTGTDGISVTVEFAGQTKETVVTDGRWEVLLDPMSADAQGRTMTVSGGGISYTFNNILVGELWLCSGQSNMEYRLIWLGMKTIAEYNAYDNYDGVRIYRQAIPGIVEPGDASLCDRWIALNDDRRALDAYEQSAYALAFALGLQEWLGDVPVGVVVSARGGTYIEEWLSSESLEQTGSSVSEDLESRYYDGMTLPLQGIPFSGVLWYQGESNYLTPEQYADQFAALCAQYRTLFSDADLPVVYAQLPQYAIDDWKDFRLMQWDLMQSVGNVYAVCGIDLGEAYNIHPADKAVFAERAAGVAARYVYGIETAPGLSAYPVSLVREGDTIVITYNNAESGLQGTDITGFEVAGADGLFTPAAAQIVGNQVVLSGIPQNVTQVRYLNGSSFGAVGLYTGNGLPAAPFLLQVGAGA